MSYDNPGFHMSRGERFGTLYLSADLFGQNHLETVSPQITLKFLFEL